MISVLFADPNGSYAGLDGVDLWDEKRDARFYAGPNRVVAHPPCARWCQLAGLVEHVYGYKKGEDEGCFESALNSVRRWGGVLEHPAYSDAWKRFDLNTPPTGGGWVNADLFGGWTCYVEQGAYGHPARKATWLYAFGINLPELKWGRSKQGGALVSFANYNNNEEKWNNRPRLNSKQASKTPVEFRDVLIQMVMAK